MNKLKELLNIFEFELMTKSDSIFSYNIELYCLKTYTANYFVGIDNNIHNNYVWRVPNSDYISPTFTRYDKYNLTEEQIIFILKKEVIFKYKLRRLKIEKLLK